MGKQNGGSGMTENLQIACEYIKNRIKEKPEIGIVLGSGLGNVADCLSDPIAIPYSEIPGFPVSTVSGHKGQFLFGRLSNKPVVLMQGRVHYYEGYSMEQVVMPIRTMGYLNIHSLILTNASGGIRDDLQPGDIMIIHDHISSFVPSPLIGANDHDLGPRFPDMTHVYDTEYISVLKDTFAEMQIEAKTGVYLQTTGPEYETPAEIQMFKKLGADAVAMSTACEAIAAKHMGIRVVGLSTICNKAAGLGDVLDHSDILEMSKDMSARMITLLTRFLEKI